MVDLEQLQREDAKAKEMSPTAAAAMKAYSCVGSPDYMAPEMLQGKGATPAQPATQRAPPLPSPRLRRERGFLVPRVHRV